MTLPEPNELISTTRATETSPIVQLHPLVLLTISDHITRHTLRQTEGPIAGAILGQQNGREVSMEVAFEAKLRVTDSGEYVPVEPWFYERVDQYKTVYKDPALDLVGWFALGATPTPHHLAMQEFIRSNYNENSIFLLFHPRTVIDDPKELSAGKLPLTLYEPIHDSIAPAAAASAEKGAMDIDSGVGAPQSSSDAVKFRQISYTVETGEAEMISVDFVARGGGNATAIESTAKSQPSKPSNAASTLESVAEKAKGVLKSSKGKEKEQQKEKAEENGTVEKQLSLSPEDEELLATITAKSNAIRMLETRASLLHTYLSTLSPSYLNDPTQSITSMSSQPPSDTSLPLVHPTVRQVASVLAGLPILTPPNTSAFERETLETKSDVALIGLLSTLTSSVSSAKEMGRKFAVVDQQKHIQTMRKGVAGGSLGDSGGGLRGRSGEYLDTLLDNGLSSGRLKWS